MSNYDKIRKLFGEPIKNISQAFYDDFVEANVRFRNKTGIKSVITRQELAKCCKWCRGLAGIYNYEDAPKDVYRRHDNCKCIVTFKGEKGYVNVWNKKEFNTYRDARITRIKELEKGKTVEKSTRSDIIKKETVRKGVGARGINEYNVINPLTGDPLVFVNNSRPIYPKDSIIAGKGSKRKINIIDFLISKYGGVAKEWVHKKAYYKVYDDYGEEAYVELHWFQNDNGIKHEMKVVFRNDEIFFYDIEDWEGTWKW